MNHRISISILTLILIGLFACENDTKDIEYALNNDKTTTDRTENLHLTYSDSSKIKIELQAPVLLQDYKNNRPSNSYYPEGILVHFYNDLEQQSTILSAKYAEQRAGSQTYLVRDSVVILSENQDTFRTEELFWNQKTGKIYTPDFFRYAKPGEEIYGYNFKSDQNFNKFEYQGMSGKLASRSFNQK